MKTFKQHLLEAVNKPKYKIYIAEPWATLLLDGVKKIETATFSLPERFENVPMYVQNEKREITGIIKFSGWKKYQSAEEFDADSKLHGISDTTDRYHFNQRIRTYGWFISYAKKFKTPKQGKPFRGQFRIQLAESKGDKFEISRSTYGDKETWNFSMNSATECPSFKLGLCQLNDPNSVCYARKEERRFHKTLPQFRERQAEKWACLSSKEIIDYLKGAYNRARVKPKRIRFSVAGDFQSQEDVDKMSEIAEGLKEIGLPLFGYSARKDLDFSNISDNMIVNGSNFMATNKSVAIPRDEFEALPDDTLKCPGECGGGTCKKCSKKIGGTIYTPIN